MHYAVGFAVAFAVLQASGAAVKSNTHSNHGRLVLLRYVLSL
jgi:hypothetical protein